MTYVIPDRVSTVNIASVTRSCPFSVGSSCEAFLGRALDHLDKPRAWRLGQLGGDRLSGKNVLDLLLLGPLPEILDVDLFLEAVEENPGLLRVALTLQMPRGGEPVYYQVLDPHNSHRVGADVDQARLLASHGKLADNVERDANGLVEPDHSRPLEAHPRQDLLGRLAGPRG